MSLPIVRRRVAAALCGCAASLGLLAALVASPAPALAQAPPALQVSAAALYAPQTGQMLFGIQAQQEFAIASTTKLMTALITLEHVHDLGTMFTQNDWYPAPADSQLGLVPGERMSVHDLLLAMMLPSADDAAEDLADNVGHGSVARFVGMMNAAARLLGLRHTHYTTPIGLDTPGNYSTATDLVRLADYDLTHSRYFARIVALPGAALHTGPVGYVVNRNDLVGRVPWIHGVKTGHTADAGYVLVASAHRNGMTLISAVLGTESEQARDDNTLALLDYGFDAFRLQTPVHAGTVLARPTVRDQPGLRVPLVAAATYNRIVARDSPVHVEVQAPRQLTGPLPARAVLGTAVVLAGTRPIARIPLLLTRALPQVSGLTVAARFMTRPLTIALVGLVLALLLGLWAAQPHLTGRRRRTHPPSAEPDAT